MFCKVNITDAVDPVQMFHASIFGRRAMKPVTSKASSQTECLFSKKVDQYERFLARIRSWQLHLQDQMEKIPSRLNWTELLAAKGSWTTKETRSLDELRERLYQKLEWDSAIAVHTITECHNY